MTALTNEMDMNATPIYAGECSTRVRASLQRGHPCSRSRASRSRDVCWPTAAVSTEQRNLEQLEGSKQRRRPRRVKAHGTSRLRMPLTLVAVALFGATGNFAAQTAADPAAAQRWGAASALLGGHLVVHGGKTSAGGGFTFTSAPDSAEILTLDVSQPWSTSSPPWQLLNASTPSLATSFHSLTPLGASELLLFGGETPSSSPLPSGNDSAYILTLAGASSLTANLTAAPASWNQPQRRRFHAAMNSGGSQVCIIGGEKTDGSGTYLDELWTFSYPASGSASALSGGSFAQGNAGSTPPLVNAADAGAGVGVVDGTLTMLSAGPYAGQLLALGGSNASGTTSSLVSFESVALFDPSKSTWSSVTTANSSAAGFPTPRRAHIAVSLPGGRIFMHGGASADLTAAYADAWLLDLTSASSQPTWSQLTATGGPSARYAHTAIAYGANVVMAFGWSGSNAADSAVYVFDGTALVSSGSSSATTGAGAWSGGSWSTNYTPDPSISYGGSVGSGGTSTGDNNDSSSSGGGTNTHKPTHKPSSNPGSNSDQSGKASSGQKAGVVVGALVGLGLVAAGAGYVVYRRAHKHQDWRRGDGAAELLGGPVAGGGGADNGYAMEKGYLAHDVGIGGSGGAGLKRAFSNAAGNIGHAIEGSGPALHKRLALLTGIGIGGAAAAHGQTRFDMLAEEDEDDEEMAEMRYSDRTDALYPPPGGRSGIARGKHKSSPFYPGADNFNAAEDFDEDEHAYAAGAHRKEISYGRVARNDIDVDDHEIGGSDRYSGACAAQYVTSPFDDPFEDGDYARSEDTHGAISAQSHALSSTPSSGPTLGTATSSGGRSYSSRPIPSFSDATDSPRAGVGGNKRVRGPRASPSVASGMKRSPTWWNRLTGSMLERSATARPLYGPGSAEPIRDPAEPPTLSIIAESPRVGGGASESDSLAYVHGGSHFRRSEGVSDGLDGMGQPIRRSTSLAANNWLSKRSHMKSLSSLRTANSSLLEAQLRSMDVVQRVRTASDNEAGRTESIRTHSASEASSLEYLSRYASVRCDSSQVVSPSDDQSTPGSVIWDPSQWRNPHIPAALQEEVSDTASLPAETGDTSAGEIALGGCSVAPPDSQRDIRALPSEAESITPATTKRARANPLLTSPLSPISVKKPDPPLVGSVKERVQAIESKNIGRTSDVEQLFSPLVSPSRSPNAVLSPIRSPRRAKEEMPPTATQREKVKYVHGLAPKAQLFVANPDREGSSSSS
ncbi:hypothetical protein K437DRAFT_272095 [Tilletiaria anomala UBC 951]|uniref:Galactose oxidase n=1 Tax=Tilletiaria anomala (strain ATCC 24038 / CBS 436.72 / UBC 951) TaxID=1037660 RepID=A0A066WG80_TILAU|nr:uncharacterized protein K437DRAFT_272095 [Tilletiaria anomala UBC 951]KDN52786.1 hypothetical protein K437DRAFT_272095 [Tilletiaria anomala UBC 951]